MTSIGWYAFCDCTNLTSITIPNSVTSIGEYAFSKCENLTDVYCYAEELPSIASNAFDGAYIDYATLHVPKSVLNDYKTTAPWSAFGSINGLTSEESEDPEVKICALPIIGYNNGDLQFFCDTEGVEFISNITCEDIKKHYEAEISLSKTYTISVYATKVGYEDSELATATLCWIECDHKSDVHGVEAIPATVVLIKASNGIITIEGLEANTPVTVCNISGTEVANGVSRENVTLSLETNLQKGYIAIVKMGSKSVKVVMK